MIIAYNRGKRSYINQRKQDVYYYLERIGIDTETAIDADSWADMAMDGETYYCDENENVILYCTD